MGQFMWQICQKLSLAHLGATAAPAIEYEVARLNTDGLGPGQPRCLDECDRTENMAELEIVGEESGNTGRTTLNISTNCDQLLPERLFPTSHIKSRALIGSKGSSVLSIRSPRCQAPSPSAPHSHPTLFAALRRCQKDEYSPETLRAVASVHDVIGLHYAPSFIGTRAQLLTASVDLYNLGASSVAVMWAMEWKNLNAWPDGRP